MSNTEQSQRWYKKFVDDEWDEAEANYIEDLLDRQVQGQIEEREAAMGYELCPSGCGGITEDLAGGPCDDCWTASDEDDWDLD